MPLLLLTGGGQTDTHGWLEGHIKEQNYGADWGDFVSFSKHMQHTAGNLGVDLLLIDTGKNKSSNQILCILFASCGQISKTTLEEPLHCLGRERDRASTG
jgi:hypothetical protein